MAIKGKSMPIVLAGLLSLGLIVTGCGQPKAAKSQPPTRLAEVAVVTVGAQRLVLDTELPGRTSAHRIAEIRPQVNGIIQKRLFQEGADVEAGELLYQIDPVPFQVALDNQKAALAKAEANLAVTRTRADRYKELLAGKAVSQQAYDDAEAALKQALADVAAARAALASARINLDYTRVTAPIAGRVGRSNVTVGALVTAYQALPLVTIQQLDPIYVDVPQSASELLRLKRRLKEGQLGMGDKSRHVRLTLEDGEGYPIDGTLAFTDVTVNPTTGSVILRMVFPNPDHLLLPGMFVRAVVHEGVAEQAVLVPQQGVSRDPKGQPIALILDSEDKVQQRRLTIDRAIGNQWLITSGLTAGDRLIVEGMQRVRPGAPAMAVPFEPAATDRPSVPANTQS